MLEGIYTPKSGRGKACVITFGICRTLDATLTIWSTTRLDLHTSRGDFAFSSEAEFYTHCVKEYGAPCEGR